MDMSDRQLANVVCVVAPGVDDAVLSALELHFAPRIEVVRERRRRERRGHERRVRDSGLETAPDRRRVRSLGGRRVDDRRRVLVARGAPSLPASPGGLRERVAFYAPLAGDEQRLEAAESLRLVVRFQLGDPDAFTGLYERHFDAVYAYLLTVLRDRYEAEDAAQDVFMRALRALPRFELRGRRFDAWLFRIVRTHALDVKRRIGRTGLADPASINVWRDRLQVRLAGHFGDGNLLSLIERLPTSQRQVIFLRYVVGLDWNDIAEALGRSSGAARQLEQRALVYLRRRLAVAESTSASRTRSMPMLRIVRASPVAARRRLALLGGNSP